MKEFIKRMITEKSELEGRIKKAKAAVENPPYGSDTEEIRMLAEQIKAMESYKYWLGERIAHHEEEK